MAVLDEAGNQDAGAHHHGREGQEQAAVEGKSDRLHLGLLREPRRQVVKHGLNRPLDE